MQLGFGFGVGGARCGWGWEAAAGERDGEEVLQVGNGGDGGGIEGCPGTDVADVPPEVLGAWVAHVDVDLAHE